MQNWNWVVALVFIVFGVYLINLSFSFYLVPKFVSDFDKFIIGISGILLILASFKFFKRNYI